MKPQKSRQQAWLSLADLDPVCRLPSALLFAALVSCTQTLTAAAMACAFALGLALLGGVSALWRRLMPINGFFLFLWIFLPLSPNTAAPDVLIHLGPVAVRQSGLWLALIISLKGNAVALAVLALAGNSSPNAFGRALLRLHVPPKLVTLMLLTYANILLMRREAGRLFQAAKLRGFAPATSLWSYRIAAYLTAMLLIRSWDRAERVALAMRLRGFSGTFPLLDDAEYPPGYHAKGHLLAAAVGLTGLLVLILDQAVL